MVSGGRPGYLYGADLATAAQWVVSYQAARAQRPMEFPLEALLAEAFQAGFDMGYDRRQIDEQEEQARER